MIKMTPANTDSPLRRSDVGVFRETVQNVTINDDEEERRESRRRTLLQTSNESTGMLEENETLKKCLEIYNGNKLSKENAWSLSLIDTLLALLNKHHKSLNNFKVASLSLEASSKVYGLRVDSIHTDVLRMSAELHAQTFSSNRNNANQDDDDDDDIERNNTRTEGQNPAEENDEAGKAPKTRRKKIRKNVSTVTKNKDSLNARLDTVPLTDPVFGKLNSIVGSINSSNRLLQNILLSTDSELHLRLNFPFWDDNNFEGIDYTEEMDCSQLEPVECKHLFSLRLDEFKLRPLQSAYVISDTPEESDFQQHNNEHIVRMCPSPSSAAFEDDLHQISMAFDINAECEPIPPLTSETAIVNVDFGDYDDLTTEERTAITQCNGLRKVPVLIEDLRPVDASSKLEYSYRPLDHISQFWAGPSYWKFKKQRNRGSTLNQQFAQQIRASANAVVEKPLNQRGRSRATKQRAKLLNFTEFHDDLFVKLDKLKIRKTNVQKKWDHRKLKLPTDFQIDPFMFYKVHYAQVVPVEEEINHSAIPDLQTELNYTDDDRPVGDHHHHADDDDDNFDNNVDVTNISSSLLPNHLNRDDGGGDDASMDMANKTVFEIATDYEGAPRQVTKIIMPFAKRDKIIDMKNLKKCCSGLIKKHLNNTIKEKYIPNSTTDENDNVNYFGGAASFQEIYNELPTVVTPAMAEALSPSVVFYSILHLANDYNLRLIQQDDLNDFKIRKVMM